MHAAKWIEAAARISNDLRDSFRTDRCVRLAFAEGDAESCGRCRALEGSEFAAENIPNFPLAGCSSPVGCAIEWENCGASDEEDEVEPWRVDDSSDEEDEIDPDPLTALRASRTADDLHRLPIRSACAWRGGVFKPHLSIEDEPIRAGVKVPTKPVHRRPSWQNQANLSKEYPQD